MITRQLCSRGLPCKPKQARTRYGHGIFDVAETVFFRKTKSLYRRSKTNGNQFSSAYGLEFSEIKVLPISGQSLRWCTYGLSISGQCIIKAAVSRSLVIFFQPFCVRKNNGSHQAKSRENDICLTHLGQRSCSGTWLSCHGLMSAALARAVTIFPRAKKCKKIHWMSWHWPFKIPEDTYLGCGSPESQTALLALAALHWMQADSTRQRQSLHCCGAGTLLWGRRFATNPRKCTLAFSCGWKTPGSTHQVVQDRILWRNRSKSGKYSQRPVGQNQSNMAIIFQSLDVSELEMS